MNKDYPIIKVNQLMARKRVFQAVVRYLNKTGDPAGATNMLKEVNRV